MFSSFPFPWRRLAPFMELVKILNNNKIPLTLHIITKTTLLLRFRLIWNICWKDEKNIFLDSISHWTFQNLFHIHTLLFQFLMKLSKADEGIRVTVFVSVWIFFAHDSSTKERQHYFCTALAWLTRKAPVVCVTGASLLHSLVLNQNNRTAATMFNHQLTWCPSVFSVYPAN